MGNQVTNVLIPPKMEFKTNFDNLDHLLTIITMINFLVLIVRNYLYKKRIKENLRLDLENNIKKLEKSSDKLIDSYLRMFGSLLFFQVYEPPNSEEKSTKLINDFYKNYRKTIKDTKDVIQIFEDYSSDLDKILSVDDNYSLKRINRAFKDKNPDFEILLKDPNCKRILIERLMAPKKFQDDFSLKLQKMKNQMDIKLTYFESAKEVLFNPKFKKDVEKLAGKYTPKT